MIFFFVLRSTATGSTYKEISWSAIVHLTRGSRSLQKLCDNIPSVLHILLIFINKFAVSDIDQLP